MRISREMDSKDWPEVWRAAYRLLEQTEVEHLLKAWVQPLELTRSEKTETGQTLFHFMAPNDFTVDWVRDHFQTKIETALEQVHGGSCTIALTVDQSKKGQGSTRETAGDFALDPPSGSGSAGASERTTSGPGSPPSSVRASARVASHSPPTANITGSGVVLKSHNQARQPTKLDVDERFTFEGFIVGASNQFSYASALSVAENPGGQYNPLFIYAPPGLGKTHLLYAIGNHIVAQNPKAKVAYLSAETFVNELIDSLQHQKMAKFRSKYRGSFDCLLIDDIQFIAAKKSTEEEFFHTFNALYGSKRQIVVTSDRPPKEIDKLEERIRTRFEWGLVADIQPPEIETRIAILKAKAERDDIYLPDDVATFLAAHIKNNVRELEGVLIRLQARASLTGAEISLEMAKHELRNVLGEMENEITVESIQNVVSRHFGIKVNDLKSSARNKNIALPRQIAMYLARKYVRLGFKDIGEYFGGKDHTTIMHACTKIERAFEGNQAVRESVEEIQNQL